MSPYDWLLRHFSARHPNYICSNCWGLRESLVIEGEICGFCDSELTTHSPYERLDAFLTATNVVEIERTLAEARKRLTEAKGGARFYARDWRQNVERVLRLKRKWDKDKAAAGFSMLN
jgi:hypothetical protein